MRYYVVSGEASGHLHAEHLIAQLREQDAQAEVRHSRGAGAYMGFIPVVTHLRTILRAQKEIERDIEGFDPDALILVDYPGLNLRLASRLRRKLRAKIFYYIAPKLWARRFDRRLPKLKRNVDCVLSILPFEVDYFRARGIEDIVYVGNPTMDEVKDVKAQGQRQALVALLPGSRKQALEQNLPIMQRATQHLKDTHEVKVAHTTEEAFRLLSTAEAALVCSGTATLEAALLGCPQVACYAMKVGRLANIAKRLLLRVRYVTLPNLILDAEAIPELIGGDMNEGNLRRHLAQVMQGGPRRQQQLAHYAALRNLLRTPGAPRNAARTILHRLKP